VVSLQPGSTIFLDDRLHVVRAIRRVDRGFQIAFEGIDDRETAEEVRGLDVSVTERRRLGNDEFWPEDLIGLGVFDQNGVPIGVVSDVAVGSSQDRLVVERPGGSMFEVPFVDPLVPVVDVEAGRIEIVSIPGLIEP
jgi:16S rRNA processing protein RimM